jgi:hypothetical protein
MRTVLILVAGFFFLAAITTFSRLFSEHYPAATTWATYAFLVLWLLATGFNMWVGVNKAGYSSGEELPIMLLLFAVPAAVAVVLKWKFL